MSEEHVRELLSAYLDGMLSGREIALLQRYLRDHPEAWQEYQQLREMVRVLKNVADPVPPPDFWPKIYQWLREQAQAEKQRSQPGQRWRSWAGALLLALVVVGVFGGALWWQASMNDYSLERQIQGLLADHAAYSGSQPLADDHRLTYVSTEAYTVYYVGR
ncbi:MAG TPA: hypothetical protein EYP85_01215 [Armatimonadetes bacterium]|nr:hypothetical protein [Armatimonadota bacterium]